MCSFLSNEVFEENWGDPSSKFKHCVSIILGTMVVFPLPHPGPRAKLSQLPVLHSVSLQRSQTSPVQPQEDISV